MTVRELRERLEELEREGWGEWEPLLRCIDAYCSGYIVAIDGFEMKDDRIWAVEGDEVAWPH